MSKKLTTRRLYMVNAAELEKETLGIAEAGHVVEEVVRTGKFVDDNWSRDWRANYLIVYTEGDDE